MARPIWKGYLAFGLVTIPVTLHSAVTPLAELDLDMLDERDHARVKFRRVNERTGREVPWKSIVKGYKSNGSYVVLEKSDFELAARDVVKGIEIVEFVDRTELDPLALEKPYYVAPEKPGEKGYVLLREALKKTDTVGIAKMVIQSRQHLAALMVVDRVLTLITMRFIEEMRAASDIEVPGERVRIAPRELEMAEMLVRGMTRPWEPQRFHDEYKSSLMKIIRRKSKGVERAKPAVEKEEELPPTYSIVEVLKQSLQKQQQNGSRNHAPPRRRGTRRKAG